LKIFLGVFGLLTGIHVIELTFIKRHLVWKFEMESRELMVKELRQLQENISELINEDDLVNLARIRSLYTKWMTLYDQFMQEHDQYVELLRR
jgi:gamma-glutamylcysteine synthetase